MNPFTRRVSQGIVLLVSLVPVIGYAQAGLPRQIVPCNGVDCNFCHLAELAQNLINTGIFITIFLSAMLFAYAGFNYMTAHSGIGGMQQAKNLLLNTALGLVIILAAWIVIDTLMKEIVDQGKFGPWNQLQCDLFSPTQ